jgi:hypothetical protein
MKYFIIIIGLLLTTGCDLILNSDKMQDYYYYSKLKLSLSDIIYPSLEDLDAITKYVRLNVRYVADPNDVWQSPAQTMSLGSGDCEDKSILFMEILYKSLGIKANLIIVDTNQYRGKAVVSGGSINHAMIEINGKPFEPQTGLYEPNAIVKYRYTFDEVFIR